MIAAEPFTALIAGQKKKGTKKTPSKPIKKKGA
jgi:hypothetical protein